MAEDFKEIGVEAKDFRAPARGKSLGARHRRAAVCLMHARAALEDFGRDSHVFGLNKGQFSMIDLLSAALEKTGPADVTAWTWCIGEYEAEAVSHFLVNGLIRGFRMVMDISGVRRDMAYIADLQKRFGLDCLRCTRTHAKIITIANDDGWRVVIRGSLNLNKNMRFEQFDVSDDPAIFDVVAGLEAELWSRGKPLAAREVQYAGAIDLLHGASEEQGRPEWAPGKKKSWF